MTWELEIEWVRGSYHWKLYRRPWADRAAVLVEQGHYISLWEAIDRPAYAALIWPMHLN